LYSVLTRFASVCHQMDDATQAESFRQQAKQLQAALDKSAWDGGWYLRAFYDDGSPLGSAQNRECKIDSIAQSWSVLSGAGSPERTRKAMTAVADRLVRTNDALLLLLTPPFNATPHNPGYIKGYPPGIRENGGQYTHAALWAVWAFAQLDDGSKAVELFRLLNPILHGDTAEKVQRYRVEPYVIAADVYSVAPHVGRGGWTWYTGSASWMYRLGIEAILGLHRKGDVLLIDPHIASNWPGYEVTYRYGKATYLIHIQNPDGVQGGVVETTIDGKTVTAGQIPLQVDGGQHDVVVRLGNGKVLPRPKDRG